MKARLNTVVNESAERTRLLQMVSISEHGVAVSENPTTNSVMHLAAVRVDDSETATQIPFEKDRGNLRLSLPGDRPSQIGFFVGYFGQRALAGAVRVGAYPGQTLTTESDYLHGTREILIGMGGIKATELDEAKWAGEIGLYNQLDFDPARSRGVFSKAYRANGANTFTEQRIVILPETMDDLLETVGPDVQGNLYQVLGYEISIIPAMQPLAFRLPDVDLSGPDWTRDRPKRLIMGPELTTGFGRGFETSTAVTGVDVISLQNAFETTIESV